MLPAGEVGFTLATAMRILGLPLSSFLVLIVIPLAIVAIQYYLCWLIKTGRRD